MIAVVDVARKWQLSRVALLLLLFSLVVPRTADAACGDEPIGGTPAVVIKSMAKGFNLPSWLDRSRPRRPDPALLAELARLGFTHVRLPFEPQLLLTDFRAAFLTELDQALDQLQKLGITVSLDNHPGAKFIGDYTEKPEEGYARMLKVWSDLTDHLQATSRDKVFFELWNEPPVDPSLWREHATRLIGALRAKDPERTMLYGEAPYERYDSLLGVEPLPFKNIVYVVHFYDPMTFTHQGADWMPSDPLAALRGVPFPASPGDAALTKLDATLVAGHHTASREAMQRSYAEPWNAERISQVFALTGAWGKAHGVPIITNEFGVLAQAAPKADREAWLRAVTHAAEDNCIGWAHWELQDGFGFVVKGVIDKGVTDAMLSR